MSTTTIIIPQFPKVQPKPTKTELIEALTERAKVKHHVDEESRKIIKNALYGKITKMAASLVKTKKVDPDTANVHTRRDSECVTFHLSVKSAELSELIRKYRAVEYGSDFDYAGTKRRIRDQINGAPKPLRLLESPEAIKALDTMLETLSK